MILYRRTSRTSLPPPFGLPIREKHTVERKVFPFHPSVEVNKNENYRYNRSFARRGNSNVVAGYDMIFSYSGFHGMCFNFFFLFFFLCFLDYRTLSCPRSRSIASQQAGIVSHTAQPRPQCSHTVQYSPLGSGKRFAGPPSLSII